MQFVANGPDIPVDVLRAQEEGRLVLFCGTGISIPAGLPDFRGLIDKVYEGLGTTPTPEEQNELSGRQPAFDRVLNLLEGPARFRRDQVRQQVARVLATPANPYLDTHRAILKLARDRRGRLRLVTTNFDGLFEAAEPAVRVTAAPLLPVPKPHKWDQLVHLHGRLDPAESTGEHLVLASADFGTAYLVERWASRFVSELFRHYTVLFLGYAVDDPPMRYLTDAIAAERRLDDRLQPAFTLVGHSADRREEVERSWAAKGIVPIPYEKVGGHAALHRTLIEWSRIWAGGLSSKLSLVRDLALKDPRALPPEVLSQFCWAVSDESGSMAQELARLGREGQLGWLEVLEKHRVLDPPPRTGPSVPIPLVDHGQATRHVPTLDPIRHGLAAWLTEHLSNPELGRWMVKKGGYLHPAFRDLIRLKLCDPGTTPPYLRKVWLALTGSVRLQEHRNAYFRLGFQSRLRQEEWGAAFRTELLEILAPCVVIHPSWTSLVPVTDDEAEAASRDTVGAILSFDCELEAGEALPTVLDELADRPDWLSIVSDIAFDLTCHLREALDFHAALDGASNEHDPSYIQHPSISPHPQNHHFHGWTRLIDLVRQAFHALLGQHRERVAALVALWSSIPYPLFRRLVLYAARHGPIPSAESLFQLLTGDPRHWLWSIATQAELFPTLSTLWSNQDEAGRARLVSILLEGPPRDMYREDLDPGTWDLTRDEAVWERLARLDRAGAILPREAASRLARIQAEHPEWRLTGSEQEDFPTWVESWSGLPTDFSAEALRALSDEELLRVLQHHTPNRRGLLEAWRHAAETDRPRAVSLLTRLLDDHYLDPGVWAHGLAGLREVGEDGDLKRVLLELLERLPDPLGRDPLIIRPAADVIKSVARAVPEAIRPVALTRWDALFTPALSVDARLSDDRIRDAINHPAGVLAEALFEMLRSRQLERNAGIADDIRPRLERIMAAEGPAARLPRVIVASRLSLLHDLDADWTRRSVLPRFDWGDPDEAQGTWQGFLWSPWVRPSLWVDLKPHFLAAFDHIETLRPLTRTLAVLLASMAVEGGEALTAQEARDCLRKLDAEGRGTVAWWLWRKLTDAGPAASELWRESIGPWLAGAWPREPGLRDPTTSASLALATTVSGERFPEAVACVRELVGHIRSADRVLDALQENGFTRTAPESCLDLVNTVTPEEPLPGFGALRDFLEGLREAAPRLIDDVRFQRLLDIAIRAGL